MQKQELKGLSSPMPWCGRAIQPLACVKVGQACSTGSPMGYVRNPASTQLFLGESLIFLTEIQKATQQHVVAKSKLFNHLSRQLCCRGAFHTGCPYLYTHWHERLWAIAPGHPGGQLSALLYLPASKHVMLLSDTVSAQLLLHGLFG